MQALRPIERNSLSACSLTFISSNRSILYLRITSIVFITIRVNDHPYIVRVSSISDILSPQPRRITEERAGRTTITRQIAPARTAR
jgi:hypothetical protein